MTAYKLLAAAAIAAALTLPGAATAQQEPLVLPDREDVPPGDPFVAEIFRDWQVRCIRSEVEEAPDRCEMVQFLEEENGNRVAEMRVAVDIPEGDDIIASATLMTPLDTLLSPGLQIRIDDNEPATVPFAFCRPIGCFVQLALEETDVEAFRNGGDAQIVLFALIRDENGQLGGAPVPTNASLRGFTAAFENLEARVVEIRAFIEEQRAAAEARAAEGDGEASE